MKYSSFREMPAWKTSLSLSVNVFKVSSILPKSEDYGLTSQIRRSANSITANIAEGFGRKNSKDKSYFYVIARGSAFETQSHLIYGANVNYFEEKEINELVRQYDELIHELNKIIKTLRSQP